jgi:hypothetical protein
MSRDNRTQIDDERCVTKVRQSLDSSISANLVTLTYRKGVRPVNPDRWLSVIAYDGLTFVTDNSHGLRLTEPRARSWRLHWYAATISRIPLPHCPAGLDQASNPSENANSTSSASHSAFAFGVRELLLSTLFGVITLGLGRVFLVLGSSRVPSRDAALIDVLDAPITPLWTWAILNEVPTIPGVIGGGVVVLAVLAGIRFDRT